MEQVEPEQQSKSHSRQRAPTIPVSHRQRQP
jgi:hypothetical protein